LSPASPRRINAWEDNPMETTDLLPPCGATPSLAETTSVPAGPDIIELPPRTEDVIDLFERFRRELENLPPSELREPMAPKLKVFEELSFLELFRLNALWHRVKRPSTTDRTDASARLARLQQTQWEDFYYYWAQPALQERWAQWYGVIKAGGCRSYRRLFGKQVANPGFVTAADYPPCHDHTTLWRRRGTPPRFAEVLVTQPYWYNLDEMVVFAKQQSLSFWVSERPAWHFPRGVFFIEWANPESQFASLRATQEADAWMRTIHAWKGEELVQGPGTVFALMNRITVEGWRDGLDVNSLMRAELTRLIKA
jgi:hypothetical protein